MRRTLWVVPREEIVEIDEFVDELQRNYHRVERSYGSFSRSFTLPNTVDTGKVSADFKNGVLTVKLPFREEARPRTINVEVSA